MNTEIKEALKSHGDSVKQYQERIQSKQSEMSQRMQYMEQIVAGLDSRSTGIVGTKHFAPNQLATRVLESEQLNAMRNGANSTGALEIPGIGIKSLVNTGRGGESDTDFSSAANRGSGFTGIAQPHLSLLEVLPVLKVSASVFEFLRNDGYQNLAATQAEEGEIKSETTLPTELIQAQIATVAHWIRASTQVLADDDALVMQLDKLLGYGVLQKLEDKLINGTGGSGEISGLLAQGTTFVPTATAPTPEDAIGEAVTSLHATGWHPNLIVMNPSDWFGIVSQKDAEERYLIGNPANPAALSLWNTPVIVNPSLASGTVIVMDTTQAILLDREAPVVLASREDGDNFRRNLVTILAELRAGLAVTASNAVYKITLD